jgi:hypothetical protein
MYSERREGNTIPKEIEKTERHLASPSRGFAVAGLEGDDGKSTTGEQRGDHAQGNFRAMP